MSIIALTHCESNLPIIGKKKAEDPIGKLLGICFQLELGSNYNKSNRIQDNGDGTISLVEVVAGGTCRFTAFGRAFGRQEVVTPIYYIKKCIQGQVYRQAQNDCKGTGTAANYYGAQKFQWCPTNDRSCEKLDSSGNFVIDETKSPAALTCKSDSFLGKQWSVTPGVSRDFQNFYERSDELPLGNFDFFWATNTYWPVDLQHASALLMNSDTSQSFLKNQFNYVLCSGN